MLQGCMENVSTIHVNVDVVFTFTIHITCNMIATIDNKYRFTTLVRLNGQIQHRMGLPQLPNNRISLIGPFRFNDSQHSLQKIYNIDPHGPVMNIPRVH